MQKINITDGKLYIKEFLSAARSKIRFFQRANAVNNRFSDCLVFVIKGECKYTFDDATHFTVKEGDILYLAYGSSYKMQTPDSDFSVIFFNFFFDTERERKSAFFTLPQAVQAEGTFSRILKAYSSECESYIYECMSLAYKILSLITAQRENTYINKEARARVIAEASYIDRNYSDINLSVSSLAKRAGVSEVYFRSIFKSALGVTPAKYITALRLERAIEFMRSEVSGLSECAALAGFSSVQYFIRVFKKERGTTPAKYLKSLKNT